MGIGFKIKQLAKQFLQNTYMPAIYKKACKNRPIEKGLVIFADSHTSEGRTPFSMQKMLEHIESDSNYHVEKWFTKLDSLGYKGMLKWIKAFMQRYAVAEYVFICDNFLPVSSCDKRNETTVTQLWHSGGILKKSGYDATDDIPKNYKGNVYKNYDLVTVSAPAVVPIFESSWRMPKGIVKGLGISRSDWYFDEAWNEKNRIAFYKKHPEAKDKKIILWAPTFRGNAGSPSLVGMEEIKKAMAATKDMYHWIIKLHPHLEGKGITSNCDIPSDKLLGVCDLLITDYSSILFDYMAYKKPFVFFAPDRKEYEEKRGFYLPYDSYPTTVAENEAELIAAIGSELYSRQAADIEEAYRYHMGSCDGKSTIRIWSYLKEKNYEG